MIVLYSGTPGSGKSLHATSDIREWLSYRHPRPVIANYELDQHIRNRERFWYVPNERMHPADLVAFAEDWWARPEHRFHEESILLVLDECQLLFNSRDWQQAERMEWLSFFSQHRKYGFHIVFVAQFDRMVDRQIRSLIEIECVHRKLGNFGLAGKVLSGVFGGNVFAYVSRYYPLNERVGVRFFRPRKSVMRMYDTYARFQGRKTGRADGAQAGVRGPAAHRPPATADAS